MQNRLSGRVAIVTGGAHGIGKAFAERLCEDGAAVAIADLDAAGAEATAAGLRGAGYPAMSVPTDVADAASTRAMAQAVMDAHGRIDVLVNNAAMFSRVPMSRVPFDQIGEDEWDKMMAVNVRGLWNACRAVVSHMRAAHYGKIVNMTSSTVWERSPTRIHYVASKAAVVGFTRTLATELGDDNICVNCISPGSTLSEEDPSAEQLAFRQASAAGRALKRVQRPEDLVGALSFFASADSDFITGQTLVVDGGLVMR